MTPHPPAETTTLTYQPAFDGMRCIAVVGIMCAHAAVVQPVLVHPASYMFVDMFFVISGYLITTMLLREHSSTGHVRLRAFYTRRVTRLYPVIVLALVVMTVTGIFWPDSPATPSWLFITASALYFANFVAIANHSDAVSAWVPLWSLSIEEQFYAVWPVVLLWTSRRVRDLRGPLALVCTLTILMWAWRSWAFHLALATPYEHAGERLIGVANAWHTFEYSTFQRPDGLLIGCAIALLLARPGSRSARALVEIARHARLPAVIVIVVMVAVTESAAAWQVYWGLPLFNICTALILVDVLHHPTSLLSRFLALRPLTWIGRRSYCIYVLHLAVFTFAFQVLELTTLLGVAAAAAAVVVLAGLSYRFFEDPVRRWGQRISTRIISDRSAAALP